MAKQNVLVDKRFDFAVRIANIYKYLITEKKEYILSKQLLRYGTSVGANINDNQGVFARKDSRVKLSILFKELRVVMYWVRLMIATDYISQVRFSSMYSDADGLGKLLYMSMKNTKV